MSNQDVNFTSAYPTWPISIVNQYPQVHVEGSQLTSQISYKATSANRLQPVPSFTTDNVFNDVTGLSFKGNYPDVAGLPSPFPIQREVTRTLPLPDEFFTLWTQIKKLIIDEARVDGANVPSVKAALRTITAELMKEEFVNVIERTTDSASGCLPPVSDQESFIGELPRSFDNLLANTFFVETDATGKPVAGSAAAQEQIAYTKRLNLRQNFVSTATRLRNESGDGLTGGPSIQGNQVEFPYISTTRAATYRFPFAPIQSPFSTKKYDSETGQDIIIPDLPNRLKNSEDRITDASKCYQPFDLPSFAKDRMYDLQRTQPNIYGVRQSRSAKFFSIAPTPFNAMFATYQRAS